jgi:hypothetical protein
MKYNTIMSIVTVCSVLLQIYVEKYGAALERQKRGHLLKTSSILSNYTEPNGRPSAIKGQNEATPAKIREATAISVHQTPVRNGNENDHVLAVKPAMGRTNERQEQTHAPPSRTSVWLTTFATGTESEAYRMY